MSFDDFTPRTSFVGGITSLGVSHKPIQEPPMATQKTQQRRSPPTFEICSDPIMQKRAPSGVYAKALASMKPGDCIKCSTEDVGKISNAMRDLVAGNKAMAGLCIRETKDYGDGMGRVWLIKKPQ